MSSKDFPSFLAKDAQDAKIGFGMLGDYKHNVGARI